jgi:hypothetical protein
MFLKTEEQCRKLKCTDVMKDALINSKLVLMMRRKRKTLHTCIHGWRNGRMFPTLQNASNENSASEMTLHNRQNKGLRMTKKLVTMYS